MLNKFNVTIIYVNNLEFKAWLLTKIQKMKAIEIIK